MATELERTPEFIEPLRHNRFIIKFDGIEVPKYLFRKYKLFNSGSEIIFLTEIMEVVNFVINPQDIFNLVGVTIEYLDPTGTIVNGITFEVKGINFIQKGDYSENEIQTTKLRMVVKEGSMKKLYVD